MSNKIEDDDQLDWWDEYFQDGYGQISTDNLTLDLDDLDDFDDDPETMAERIKREKDEAYDRAMGIIR